MEKSLFDGTETNDFIVFLFFYTLNWKEYDLKKKRSSFSNDRRGTSSLAYDFVFDFLQ